MPPRCLPRFVFPLFALALGFALVAGARAQVVSAGITGRLSDPAGKPVAGASVIAKHEPTATTYAATTGADGRYNFRGLIAGGPYSMSASVAGLQDAVRQGITTQLGTDIDVDLTLKPAGETVVLEKFMVRGEADALDSGATGAGSVLTEARLTAKPTSERSLADMVSATPLVTLRSFTTVGGIDREEPQLTAVGQNVRFNSFQIDGNRINDQFGLNFTGLASFFNPLSLDTLDQLSVQVSPYDIRQAGFTGASINAVTKSGTNQLKGSAYFLFRGDHLAGLRLHGVNENDRVLRGQTIIPQLDRQTRGFTLGGPLLRDRLFFFVNYEKLRSSSAGRDPIVDIGGTAQTIMNRFATYSTASNRQIDWGQPATFSTVTTSNEEKKLAKLDWNIAAGHRASLRYSQTEGLVPQFGNYANNSFTLNGVAGGPTTGSTGHFFAQARKEKSWSGQLISQWTNNLKTELRYSTTKQDQLTPTQSVAPLVSITGLPGTDLRSNAAINNATFVAGVEINRQGNVILVDTKQISAIADYFAGPFVITAGFQREDSDFYNLFRQGYGTIAFRTLDDFLNDRPAQIQRNVVDLAKRPAADLSAFATNGLFAQARWDIAPRLNLTGGLRYEWTQQPTNPPFNARFFADTGFRNDGNLDGVGTISPRASFNWAIDPERAMQLRGGVGHFTGRLPWVFLSNSYNRPGLGNFTQIDNPVTGNTLPAGAFTAYLRDRFDPANPIGVAADTGTDAREIDWNDNRLKMPAVWRGNLALDRRLPFLNSLMSVEWVETRVQRAVFITNENLRPTGQPAADGRIRFAGNTSTVANRRFANYTNLYHISNISDAGRSRYFTLMWDRPLRNRWAANFSYTRGNATEAQSLGGTTASGVFGDTILFNQNTPEVATANTDVRDRVQITLTREFELAKRWRTQVSLYYEGRSGNPYSRVYSNDFNGDGLTGNDVVAVPSGPADPRFDFSGLTTAQLNTYLGYMRDTGLEKYAGGIAPRNAFFEPWVNRLDLHFSQFVPIYQPAQLELFFDFVNFGGFLSRSFFGYVETASGNNRFMGSAAYGTDGRIRPTVAAPSVVAIDNAQSRWRVNLGARLRF